MFNFYEHVEFWNPPFHKANHIPYSKKKLLQLRKNDIRCVYCGKKASGFDHKIPKCMGGNNKSYNLVPACSLCNHHKDAIPFDIYPFYRAWFTEDKFWGYSKYKRWRKKLKKPYLLQQRGEVLENNGKLTIRWIEFKEEIEHHQAPALKTLEVGTQFKAVILRDDDFKIRKLSLC